MEVAIIASSEDIASSNIYKNLISSFDFRKINEKFRGNDVLQFIRGNTGLRAFLINGLIHAENLDREIKKSELMDKIDLMVFVSRHVSKENTPSFTVHSIGNWGKADYGGKDRALCQTHPIFLKSFFAELNKNLLNKNFLLLREAKNFQVTMEATHHGPYVECPAVFVEIGSTENEWSNEENGKIISHSIISALNKIENNYKVAIGFGGTHYCSNFNKIMLNTDIAFSFICPKHSLEKLDKNLLQQAVNKTHPKVDFAVLDWKGLGREKRRIIKLLEETGLEYKRNERVD